MASSKLIFLCVVLVALSATVSAGLFDPLTDIFDEIHKYIPERAMINLEKSHDVKRDVVPNTHADLNVHQ